MVPGSWVHASEGKRRSQLVQSLSPIPTVDVRPVLEEEHLPEQEPAVWQAGGSPCTTALRARRAGRAEAWGLGSEAVLTAVKTVLHFSFSLSSSVNRMLELLQLRHHKTGVEGGWALTPLRTPWVPCWSPSAGGALPRSLEGRGGEQPCRWPRRVLAPCFRVLPFQHNCRRPWRPPCGRSGDQLPPEMFSLQPGKQARSLPDAAENAGMHLLFWAGNRSPELSLIPFLPFCPYLWIKF